MRCLLDQHDEAIPPNSLIATDPAAGAMIPPGSTVKLIVSDGPAPRTVPSIPSGLTYDQAAAAIAAVQLKPVQAGDFSDTVAAGGVIRTDPPAGSAVARDSNVSVVISKGPQFIVVPYVVGQTVENGGGLINSLGLVADIQGFQPGKKITGQSVAPGTQVRLKTHISLTL